MRHWTSASIFVEKASGASPLTKLHRRLLVLKELNPGATGLRKGLEECLWTLQIIQSNVSRASTGNRDENLSHPIGMTRTAWNVDDWQSPLRLEVRSKKPPCFLFKN